MLALLPYDILIIVYQQLCFSDQKHLTDTSKAIRLHFIHNRYKCLIINRHHCVPNKLDWKYHDIGFVRQIEGGPPERLFIPSDEYNKIVGFNLFTPLWPLESINIMIHWSADKAESILKLLQQLNAWDIGLNVCLMQHGSLLSFQDVVRIDIAFQLLSCVRLTRTLYGLLTKVCFSDGKVSKLRFSVPMNIDQNIEQEEFKLPDDIYEVEFTSSEQYRVLDTCVLRHILNANSRSNIRKLSIEGHRKPDHKSPDFYEQTVPPEEIVLPPSVTYLNYYLFNNSSMGICSGNVHHLSVKPHPEAETFDDYAVVIAYFDRNEHLLNGSSYACYEVDLRSLKLRNAVSATVVLDNRLWCNLWRRWNMNNKAYTCLWGIESSGFCSLQSLDITIIQNAGHSLPTIRRRRSPPIKELKMHGVFLLFDCPVSEYHPSIVLTNKENVLEDFIDSISLILPSNKAHCTVSEAVIYNNGNYAFIKSPTECKGITFEKISTPYVTKAAHERFPSHSCMAPTLAGNRYIRTYRGLTIKCQCPVGARD